MKFIFKNIFKNKEFLRWQKDKGDKTFRLNYDLNNESLVFDLGGYEGQWASDIFSKYLCKIYVFEPVLSFVDNIKKRFKNNSKIKIFNFGLGGDNKIVDIYLKNDGSSIFGQRGEKQKAKIVKISDFIKDNKISFIDLMKINIEGAEYELMEDLLKTNLIEKIKDIQIQFHNLFLDSKTKMIKIQNGLSETHCLTYQYKFIWENWRLKTEKNRQYVEK